MILVGLGAANPGMLWFGFLAAVPLIIYLIHQQRYRRVRWAAMEFLLRAARRTRRRLQVENLLLLLIRTAIIVLLVSAMARPVAESIVLAPAAGRTKVNWIAVLDTSYSMRFRDGSRSLFLRAREMARDLVARGLVEADRFDLVTLSSRPEARYADPVSIVEEERERILRDLDEIRAGAQPADVARTLGVVRDVMERFEEGPKRVVIFSDFQRKDWLAEDGPRDPAIPKLIKEIQGMGGEFLFVDLGPPRPGNLALTSLAAGDALIGVDVPAPFTVWVSAFDPPRTPDLTLTVEVDGQVRMSRAVHLDPGKERIGESFFHVFREAGPHTVSAEIRSDLLDIDNRRGIVVDVRERVEILIVDGEPSGPIERESFFLESALGMEDETEAERLTPFRIEVVPAHRLDEVPLDRYDLVILANLASLSDRKLAELEDMVREGAGAVVFMGGNIDREFYRERLYAGGSGILPADLVEIAGDPSRREELRFQVAGESHPVMERIAGMGFGWANFSVFQFYRLVARPDVQVLVRTTDPGSSPVILEGGYGRGRVVVVATSADDEWSNFPKFPVFVAFLHEVIPYLLSYNAAVKNLLVGEPYTRMVESRDYASDVMLTSPDGVSVRKVMARIPGENRFRLDHEDTLEPGIYTLDLGREAASTAPRRDYFAVNVETSEGNLRKLSREDFRDHFPDLRFQMAGDLGAVMPQGTGDRGRESGWWRQLVWAVLLLLFAETALGQLFGRPKR